MINKIFYVLAGLLFITSCSDDLGLNRENEAIVDIKNSVDVGQKAKYLTKFANILFPVRSKYTLRTYNTGSVEFGITVK